MLGLLGLRIFEARGASIGDLGEEHGHRVLKVRGKGDKTVLIPLPPAVARAIDRAVDGRGHGPILRNIHGARMDRHAATRRMKQLAGAAGIQIPRMHPHMLRHTYVTTATALTVAKSSTRRHGLRQRSRWRPRGWPSSIQRNLTCWPRRTGWIGCPFAGQAATCQASAALRPARPILVTLVHHAAPRRVDTCRRPRLDDGHRCCPEARLPDL
jgi:Phage integrase family